VREAIAAEHSITLPEPEAAYKGAILGVEPADPDIVVVGKWRIEPGEASFDGKVLPDLCLRHRRLLRPLVEARGRTVTMTALRLCINEDVADKDNAIKNYISGIRKAIQLIVEVDNPIEDKDGKGYRLTLL
jgi:DNA-binding response OmpR family regulator